MRKKQHTDREKASALLAVVANKGNVKKTSTEQEIPHKTLDNWTKGIGVNQEVRKMVEENCLDLALELDSLAYQAAGLLPDKMPGASVRDLVGVMSQSIEKSQLLKGKATNITGKESELEEAKRILDFHRRTNETYSDDEKLSDYQIFKFAIKPNIPGISPQQLQIEVPENQEVKGNEDKDPAPVR